MAAVAAIAFSGTLRAETTRYLDEDAQVWVVSVPEGETYAMAVADSNEANGRPIAKRGAGTAEAGAAMQAFTGELRIEEGVYKAKNNGGLGTAVGGTVVSNSATLALTYSSGLLDFGMEPIVLAGVIANNSGRDHPTAFGGPVSLAGDATISGATIGMRGSLALNGHLLTINMNTQAQLYLTNVAVTSAGDITVSQGRLNLDGSTSWEGDDSNRLTLAAETTLSMRQTTGAIPWTLVVGKDAILMPVVGGVDSFSGNVWGGPVIVEDRAIVRYTSSGTCFRLYGPVSGGALAVSQGTWLELGCGANSFTNGVTVTADVDSGDGGLVLSANGALPVSGKSLTLNSGTIRLSEPIWYDLPHIVANSGGTLSNSTFGYGGTIKSLTKWGALALNFDSCLAVTGRMNITKSTLRLGRVTAGTAGLRAAVTNFANQTEWESFRDAANSDFADVAANLLSVAEEQGFARTVLSPEDAYRQWNTSTEANKMGVYSGCIWNNDLTNKVYSFAASIADTQALWINGSRLFLATKSKTDAGGQTYFVSVGEATLKPGPNEFMFLLGRKSAGTKTGTRDDLRPQYGVNWTKNNGVMYKEGAFVLSTVGGYENVTNYLDFAQIVDPGDGSLLTIDRNPSATRMAANPANYRPRFDQLEFGRDTNVRCTFDLGGHENFPQNGLVGCPCVTNGSMTLSGTWSVAKADLDVHPLEVAAGAGVTFDGATLAISATGLARDGVTVLHAEPGATVTGTLALDVSDGGSGKWALRREESDGAVDFVLCRIPPGLLIKFQ